MLRIIHVNPQIRGKNEYINNILLQLSLYIGKNIKLVIVRQITEPKAGPVINIPMIIILLFPVKYVFAIFGIPTEIPDKLLWQ